MARVTQEHEEFHPRPMAHPHDPSRRRWFVVSVAVTSVVAVAGWMYFFSGQVSALVHSTAAVTASDTLKNFATQTKTLGSGAVDDFKTSLAPAASAAVADVQAKLKAQADLAGVIDKMTDTLAVDPNVTAEASGTTETESQQ